MDQFGGEDRAIRVTCPTCRQVSELPGSIEGLPNNFHALHFVELANEKKSVQ